MDDQHNCSYLYAYINISRVSLWLLIPQCPKNPSFSPEVVPPYCMSNRLETESGGIAELRVRARFIYSEVMGCVQRLSVKVNGKA